MDQADGCVTNADGGTASLLIAVPFYRNERLVESFVTGLNACADEVSALGAQVVFYNDSPDYAPLGEALQQAAKAAKLDISVQTNPQNLGWVGTANAAMQQALNLGADLILFNSDTMLFPGALSEMARVAKLDPMIGFVNPRSNNATIASFPIGERFQDVEPEQAAATHKALAHLLPEVSYVPTCVGFAMLIRKNILQEFGFFDEVYGVGYCEENDLVMRASRCGYRAVLANRAFVWHQGEQSFEGDARKEIAERANNAILTQRYPEYGGLINHWFHGPEHRAELLVSQLSPGKDGKLRIAFDLSTFGLYHSGTQKAGVQLLKTAQEEWSDRYELYALCNRNVFEFHGIDAIDGVQQCDPHGPELFAVVFRMGQPFDWDTLRRLALKGAVTGIAMLDTISIDCSHLHDEQVSNLWHYALQTSDFITYNSEFTQRQFALRFPASIPELERASLHSLDFADYQPSASADEIVSPEIAALPEDYVLIFGNQYPHKAVGHIANRLAEELPQTQFVALGVTSEGLAMAGSPGGLRHARGQRDDKLDTRDNLRGFRVGLLADADIEALQSKAKIMVMPSHYEGFGFPAVHALAIGKPMIVRRLPPLVEIWEQLGKPKNLHFFDTTDELIELMRRPPVWDEAKNGKNLKGDAIRAAEDIRQVMEQALARASYARMAARFRIIHTIFGVSHNVPATRSDFAAQRVARATEIIVRNLFRVPGVLPMARGAYRVLDAVRRRR